MALPDSPACVLRTTQDFGCVCHEEGPHKNMIFSEGEVKQCKEDFLKACP